MEWLTIAAEIVFLSAEEGGRRELPAELGSGTYMPHVVVGDPTQRHALLEGNRLIEEYLGVRLVAVQTTVVAGRPFEAELRLMYHPAVDYRDLTPGATFTLREGPHIVGYGRVLSRKVPRSP